MIEGNGAEAVEQIFDAGIGGDDVVLAQLAEEPVALVSASNRHDDVAAQFVVDAKLHGVGEHADRAGIASFGDELFGIEVNVETPGRTPGQSGAIGGAGDGFGGRVRAWRLRKS